MNNVKLIVSLVLLVILVTFAVQNTQALEVKFLFWSFTLRRALMLFVFFAIGTICGYLVRSVRRNS